ncbi:MAG: hypothetical protein F6K56_42595 [Moorea sp. SIO3G5]|nr:hypothetical protein [Moorena sp. SIO3G5]
MPLASCLPLLGGVRGGFLLPLAFPSWEGLGVGSSCLLPVPCSLFPVPVSYWKGSCHCSNPS